MIPPTHAANFRCRRGGGQQRQEGQLTLPAYFVQHLLLVGLVSWLFRYGEASLISSGITNSHNLLIPTNSDSASSNSGMTSSFLNKLLISPPKSPLSTGGGGGDPCYDALGKAKRCITDFVNAAFGKEVQATSTCGVPPSRYCQTSYTSEGQIMRNCFICDDNHPKRLVKN